MVRLLALDVDGTLTTTGNHISPTTRAALHRLHGAGVEVVISTGRRYRTTRLAIEALGLDVAAVCLGGALVKERDQTTLAAAPYSPQSFRQVATLVRERGHVVVAQRDAHGQGGPDFLIDGSLPWNRAVAEYQRRNAEFAARRAELAYEARDDVLVAGTFGEEAPMRALADAIQQRFAGRFVTNVMEGNLNDGYYCEILPSTTTKWSGIARFAAARRVAAEEIWAVGDQTNDLAMLTNAGLGVAMGNAPPEVKAAAGWVTGRNDEDGLVAVVERIFARLGDAPQPRES